MSNTVVIKSNRYGINLILDEQTDFRQILSDISGKFRDAASFFKGAKMVLSYEGRKLSQEEELQMVEAIEGNSNMMILCVMEQDELKEQLLRQMLEPEEDDDERACRTGEFYKGTLRSGQVLECETSVVVLGDVNPGAKIVSKGNIVVLGSLKGNAYAGASGNRKAFVAALEMDPVQIKIGDVIGRSADRALWSGGKKKKKAQVLMEPQVAVVKDENVYIEPITKGLLNNL